MARVTIQEIAKKTGFSRNTVALALKGSEIVSASTRQQVHAAAVEMGYFRQLQPQAAEPGYLIMLLRRPNDADFWDKLMGGIMKEARQANCALQMSVILEEDIAANRLPVGYLENVDAFLFLNVFPREYVRLLLGERKTGIFLDGGVKDGEDGMAGDLVKSEGIRSTCTMTEHLIRQGLRRIEFFSSYDVETCQTVHDRLLGYQKAMAEAGLEATGLSQLRELNRYNVYDPRQVEAYLDQRESLPEAFVCSNDVLADRLLLALKKRGIRVPEDVALTGFDNVEERNAQKMITTADFNAEWLGRRLFMQVLWRIRHPEAPLETVVVDSRVIYRRSSDKSSFTGKERT